MGSLVDESSGAAAATAVGAAAAATAPGYSQDFGITGNRHTQRLPLVVECMDSIAAVVGHDAPRRLQYSR